MLTRMVAAVGQLSADTEPRVCVFAEEPSCQLVNLCFLCLTLCAHRHDLAAEPVIGHHVCQLAKASFGCGECGRCCRQQRRQEGVGDCHGGDGGCKSRQTASCWGERQRGHVR